MKRALIVTTVCIIVFFSSAKGQDTSPQFTTQPSDQIAHGTVTLPCRVTGSPLPSVQWFKDGTAVGLSARVVQHAVGDLYISSVQASDGGGYHCLANNTVGSVRSRTGNLQVAFIDALPAAPPQPPVADNSPVVLPCPLPPSVPRPPTVTWTSTTGHIPNEMVGVARSTGDLVFSFFNDNVDEDTYTCTVSNAIVGSSQVGPSYFLTTAGATPGPLFRGVEFVVRPISAQTLVAGETLYLECLTTGRPAATITWRKDNAPLSNGGRVIIEQYGRSLTITSVVSADSGEYKCVAEQQTSSTPNVITSSGNVTVADHLQVTSSFGETASIITQTLTLSCEASQSTLPLEWVWFVDGTPITQSADVSYATSGRESVLRVGVVGEGSGGVYQCAVTQPLTGQTDNANELVTVVGIPPTFTTNTSDRGLLLFEGDNVTLPCRAEGFPTPTFQWRRSGGPLQMTERHSQSSLPGDGSLTIVGVIVGDSSNIQCVATNIAGTGQTGFITLRVIPVPTVIERPADTVTPTQGTTQSLSCSVSSDYTLRYQWRRELITITYSEPSPTGTLTLEQVDDSANGVYVCLANIEVTGVNSDPISYEVGSTVLTVGGPAQSPSQPGNPRVSAVTSSSFTANWDTPTSDGGLPLRSFSIEVLSRGSADPSCLEAGDFTWREVATGIDPMATNAMVTELLPNFLYSFRVRAFTHQFQGPWSDFIRFQTLQASPQAPPTNVRASPAESPGAITVTWGPPTPCTTHGGPLTTYTVQYKVHSEGEWSSHNVGGVTPTQHTLSGLLTGESYDVRVAGNNDEGRGPFSAVTMVMTREGAQPGPLQFTSSPVNSTSVRLSWQAPPTVTSYTVSYRHTDGRVGEVQVGGTDTSVVIHGLRPGSSYTFSIVAVLEGGVTTQASVVTAQLPTEATPFYEEVWFIAAMAAVVMVIGIILMVVVMVICFKCCCKCGSENGKIYVTSRRSASSLSGSSGFSEFQHKRKATIPITKSIHVHSSPTPSRRTADYADLNTLQPAHSTTYTESQQFQHHNGQYPHGHHMTQSIDHMTHSTGHVTHSREPSGSRFIDDPNDQLHMYPPDQPDEPDYPIDFNQDTDFSGDSRGFKGHDLSEQHVRRVSGGVNQPFFDTLSRVHTPPPPTSHSPTPPHSSTLSQETTSSWNPAESLNPRGHMTNNPVSRSNSNRSSQTTGSGWGHVSSLCSTPQKHDLANRRNGFLSPVHEQRQRSGEGHVTSQHEQHHRGESHVTSQHEQHHRGESHVTSQQEQRHRGESHVTTQQEQEFPPRSNSVHSHMSRSTGHISHGNPRHHSLGAHSQSAVNARHLTRGQGMGMELGSMTPDQIQSRELPPLPMTGTELSRNPSSAEYSSIPPTRNSNPYPPPTDLPPPPEFRHSPTHTHFSGNQIRLPSPPPMSAPPTPANLTQRTDSPSPVYTAPLVKPKPSSHARRNLQNGFGNHGNQYVSHHGDGKSDLTQGAQHMLSTHAHAAHPHRPPPLTMPIPTHLQYPENSGSTHSSGTGASVDSWPLNDLQRQFEADIKDLEELQSMLTPVVTDPPQTQFTDPPQFSHLQALRDQADAVRVNDGGPLYPRQLSGNSQSAQHLNRPAPGKPAVAPKPPKQRHLRDEWADDHTPMGIGQGRPNVPDLNQLKQLDPRKPRQVQGKVRGSVWQPRSMNQLIESSSDSGSESDGDTVLGADTSSLKSCHV